MPNWFNISFVILHRNKWLFPMKSHTVCSVAGSSTQARPTRRVLWSQRIISGLGKHRWPPGCRDVPEGVWATFHPPGFQRDSGCTKEASAGFCSFESGHPSKSVTFQGKEHQLIWVTLSVCFCCTCLVASTWGLSSITYRLECELQLECSSLPVL